MKRQAEAAEERDRLILKIAENKRIECEQAERVHTKNLGHQDDLINQMRYNESVRRLDGVSVYYFCIELYDNCQ